MLSEAKYFMLLSLYQSKQESNYVHFALDYKKLENTDCYFQGNMIDKKRYENRGEAGR
jgi:hypothetical protein